MDYPVISVYATGKKIKQIRRERAVTVADVCRFLGGISEQAVYKWEQGKSIPSTDNLYALSHLFQVHMEEMIVEEADSASSFFGVKMWIRFFTRFLKFCATMIQKGKRGFTYVDYISRLSVMSFSR